MPQIKLLKALN